MSANYIPERGDIVILDIDSADSAGQKETKQALVISPAQYNRKTSMALFCPIKTKVKGYPFEVNIPENLNAKGVILSDQVKSLNWKARNAEFVCALPADIFSEVISKLNSLI